jgi:hypothetical protein
MTGAALTSVANLSFKASLSSFTSPEEYCGAVAGSADVGVYVLRFFATLPLFAAAVVPPLPVPPDDFACFSMAALTFAASLPLTVSRTWLFRVRTR